MEAPPESLAELVAREYMSPLFTYVFRKVKSREDAKDLCQDVLARLVNVPASSIQDVQTFLHRCAAAVVADYYRRKNLLRLVPLNETDGEQAPHLQEDLISAVQMGELFERAMTRIPVSVARDVYIKRLLEHRSYASIAAELNITVESAYVYYCNIHKQVLQIIWAQGGPTK